MTKMLLPALMPSNSMLMQMVILLLLALAESQAQLHEYPPTECVHEFSSSQAMNGSFQSPNYPESYPSSTVCRYIFQGKGRERVQIMFTALDLHYPSGDPKAPYDCEDVDSVTVGVNIEGQHRDLGVYCGNKRPPMLMSNDNRLEVVFQSIGQSSSGSKGFRAEYKFVTNFGIKAGEQSTDMVCSFIFKSEVETNGTFRSPNFPGLYPRNTECHYLFYGKSSERIHITFPYFDVEGIPPSCTEDTQSDFVEFSNFNIKLKDRKMTRFCGTREDDKTKKEVKSDGNFFRVTFKSNDVYDSTGFEAFYQFRKYEEPCSQWYDSSTSKNGSFHSPGFPAPYSPSSKCNYTFLAAENERVQVTFTTLDLYYPSGDPDEPSDCEDMDSVKINTWIDNEWVNIGVYCGRKMPPLLMSSGKKLQVVFHSEKTGNGTLGFKADYQFVTDYATNISDGVQNTSLGCSFTFKSEQKQNGTFRSPNFPGLYPKNTVCDYLFFGKENERVEITFPYFDVEGIAPTCSEETQSDFIEFSNFKVRVIDRKMSRFCGRSEYVNYLKRARSDGSFFRVTFKSNAIYDATGFEAVFNFRRYEDPFNTL